MDSKRREGKEGEKDVKDVQRGAKKKRKKKKTDREGGWEQMRDRYSEWKCLGQLIPGSQSERRCEPQVFLLSVFPSNTDTHIHLSAHEHAHRQIPNIKNQTRSSVTQSSL